MIEVVKKFSGCRIAVVGDLMIDSYVWGAVERISPEAPVPVVQVTKTSCCLGGAANVMRNLSTLGASAEGYGVVGCDPAAAEVSNAFAEAKISSFIESDPGRPTTEKLRVMASGQQLLRIDDENTTPVSDEIRRKLVNRIIDRIRDGKIDAVIFEDYAKGLLASWMLEEIVAAAKEYDVFTALDPKPGGIAPVKGLTVIKPNRLEAFAMAGIIDSAPAADPQSDAILRQVADTLLDLWEPEHLLISLASQGMALFDRRSLRVIPTRAREVFDVSGAGDTVTATYALSLASGADPVQAAEIANRAAGIVVAKVGTAPILFDELKNACLQEKI